MTKQRDTEKEWCRY